MSLLLREGNKGTISLSFPKAFEFVHGPFRFGEQLATTSQEMTRDCFCCYCFSYGCVIAVEKCCDSIVGKENGRAKGTC